MLEPKTLPTKPGVYIFKNATEEIIYIGKAKSLRNRVSQYFQNKDQSVKTQHLVSHINDIDFIIVNNELEALLLENKLIKQHKPKYNILLKDSKTYAYIKITDEPLPRIVSTRIITKKGTYFGPYADGSARFELVKLTNQVFKLRTQKQVCKKPCLNYHIGLCSGSCVGKISKEEYLETIEGAKKFLRGDTKEISARLKTEMQTASKNHDFERALLKRKQLEAIETLQEKQSVDLRTKFDQDVIGFVAEQEKMHISMFHIKKGVIAGKEEYHFEMQEDIPSAFIKEYYSTRIIPREIIVNDIIKNVTEKSEEEITVLEEYLTTLRQGPVTITIPQQGSKMQLLILAMENAKSKLNILDDVQRALDLPMQPRIIECFDISNLGREHIVAGMVRFVDGKPDHAGYRRFAMKEQIEQNDFAAMHEAVFRRYSRLKQERFELPQLIIIDGGKGQLSAACQALREARVDVPICSLAKREEELYFPDRDRPLNLDNNSKVMLFIRGIRDRVHNYALSYNKKKRSMGLRDEFDK